MDKTARKQIAKAFTDAMEYEGLNRRQAAACINIEAKFITFLTKESYYSNFPSKYWARLEMWFDQRCRLTDFIIPEGEERIYAGNELNQEINGEAQAKNTEIIEHAPAIDADPSLPRKKKAAIHINGEEQPELKMLIEKLHFQIEKIQKQDELIQDLYRRSDNFITDHEALYRALVLTDTKVEGMELKQSEDKELNVVLHIDLQLSLNGQQIKIA